LNKALRETDLVLPFALERVGSRIRRILLQPKKMYAILNENGNLDKTIRAKLSAIKWNLDP
jgi:hypothetical protein